jgi:cold shock CspA family protein
MLGEEEKGPTKRRSEWTSATVKSYRPDRGFGFLRVEGVERDVYVHADVAKTCSVPLPLNPGQEVMVRWRMSDNNRPQAASIKLA